MAALRNEEKVWVNGEIATAIQEHLHPHGWRKLSLFLKTWIPLGTAIGVLVALLALAGAGWNYAFSRVEKETQFQTHTTDALKQIDQTLIGLQTSITLMQAQIAASKYSAISKKELKGYKTELQSIKTSLAKAPKDTPNFWPTSFQIITLLSQAISQLETIGKQPLSIVDDVRIIGGAPSIMSNQNVLLKNTMEGINFSNSVVHFDPSVRLINVGFANCVFIFPADASPPKPLQQIGEALLASDLSHVTISAS